MRETSQRGRLLATIFVATAVLLALAGSAAQAQIAGTSEAQVRTGKMAIGQWTERIKLEGGGEQVVLVTAYYDWQSGEAFRELHDERGHLVRRIEGRKAPRPSPEEIQEAMSMVYADSALGSLIRQQRLTVDGGFLLEQGPGEGPCTQGSRCLQIFLFDGVNVARHTVVDLKRGRLVYRNYVPPQNREIR